MKCKAFTKQNKQCSHNASVNGLCLHHFFAKAGIKSKNKKLDHSNDLSFRRNRW